MAPPSIPNRYADVHKSPQGPGDARPTALQILKDNDLLGDKLADKTILVTGGASGLGLGTVRELLKTGARVVFTARNEEKAKATVQQLTEEAKAGGESTDSRLDWVEMNFSSLDSVHRGAEAFIKKSKQLNVLICNAGVANIPFSLTKDGYESQFGINVLANFRLFLDLKPLLLASSTASFPSRVVTVSSSAHGFSTVQIGNYNLSKRPTSGFDPLVAMDVDYNPMIAYGQSKTADIWLANEIDRRWGAQGLHGISVHPGNVMTAMFENLDPIVAEKLGPLLQVEAFQKSFKSVEQGVATQVLAAVGKDYQGVGGFYMDNCGVARALGDDEMAGLDGYRPWAYDAKGAQQLWKDALDMIGVKEE